VSDSALRVVYLLNNYDASGARDGRLAANHLFGTANPPQGWRTEMAPRMLHHVLKRIPFGVSLARFLWRVIGDPVQASWVALQKKPEGSVVWIATQAVSILPLVMRAMRVIRVPVFVLYHSATIPILQLLCARYADGVVVFSERTARELALRWVKPERIRVLPWGPDLMWEPYTVANEVVELDMVAFGKTHRDYESTIKAAQLLGLSMDIYSAGVRMSLRHGARLPDEHFERLSNEAMIARIKSARAVIIPVRGDAPAYGLTGLTELCDAIACRIPVIMTRNSALPFDLEECRVGAWISPDFGPVELARAIELSQAARFEAFEELLAWWNESEFSKGLFRFFDEAGVASHD
jgi:glycosyltransferase involved in cell wall biosynthesis